MNQGGDAGAAILTSGGTRRRTRWRVTAMDGFLAANVVLLAVMAGAVYFDRWLSLRGPGAAAVAEFLFYAFVLFSVVGLLWAWLRRYPLSPRLLVMMEAGALAHFAGGLLHFGGVRLYGHVFLGLRFDKYVHAANTWIVALLVQEICRLKGWSGVSRWRVALAAFALGLAWEGCEALVVLTIPGNGVGSFADTLRDLFANACGALLFVAVAGNRKPFPR